MSEGKGLGDIVEKAIVKIAPRIAEKKKGCIKCQKRKKWLNNINANFG